MTKTEGEAKAKRSSFMKKVRDWRKANPEWGSNKFLIKVLDQVSESTHDGYRSAISKFCTFLDMTPDDIIKKRAKDLMSETPNERTYFETKMGEFKELLISLNYRGTTIKTTLGNVAGLFTNNAMKLNLGGSFYDENQESDYVKRTTKKYIYPPSNDEIRSIYGIADLDTKVMILLGYHAAMNPIDVVKTSWDQIGVEDWEAEDRDYIAVQRERSKTDVGFFWFVGPDLKYVLTQKWVRDGKPTTGYLFPKRVEEDGKRFYDPNQYLANNKVNEKFKPYVEMALTEDRAKEISFTDLRDSFNDAVLGHVENSEVKSVLMGHVRANAKKRYKISPATLLDHYKKVYDYITVNGWKYKLKAEGFDELQDELLDQKAVIAKLQTDLEETKAWAESNFAAHERLREEYESMLNENAVLKGILVSKGIVSVDEINEITAERKKVLGAKRGD